MADALDSLGNPPAVTLQDIITHAGTSPFTEWLRDPKNSRKIPHRLEACGYTPIRNRHTKDGHWVIGGRRQVIYAKSDISERDRLAAAASAYGVAQW